MRFPYDLRFEHCYIPGKTGHGKTTLMQHMALQDIENGAGVTFIDPGGDAVKELLQLIPEHRKDDCYYLDFKNVVPFQIFNCDNPFQRDELVKDMTYLLLKGIPNAPSAENYIQRVAYTLLSCTIPVCFLDAYYFLTKTAAPWGTTQNRYNEIIEALPDSDLKQRWQADFPKDDRKLPILIRLEPFINNTAMRKLFGTPDPSLDIADAMNSRKILLVDLGGASQAKMEYGALLFAKIKQEVFRRAEIENKRERIPHFVFIDEFEAFTNPENFPETLKMARKYRCAMTLASLTLSELDPRMKTALGIISNYVIFCLNPEDVSYFKRYAPQIDLGNIPKYCAVYKIGSDVEYQMTPEPLELPRKTFAEYIRKRSVDNSASQTKPKMLELEEDGPTLLSHREQKSDS